MKEEERKLFMKKFLPIVIGNVMEMFDFAVFGALVDIIGDQFFPNENKTLQLLQVFAIFGAAFIMRPFGGVLLGWIGDTLGRKRALEISISLMLFPSFIIGCLPVYSQAGIFGTVLLLVMRMIQGIAVGGEVIGSYIFTIEATNGENRGFWGACCKSFGLLGNVLGLGFSTFLRTVLTHEQMYSWGWRIPFLISILFGIAGVYLRHSLTKLQNCEGEEYQQVQHNHDIVKNPLFKALHTHWREISVILIVSAFWGVMFYSCFVWLIYFMSNEEMIGGPPVKGVWILFFTMNVVLVLALPLAGYLADLVGILVNDKDRGIRIVMISGLIFTLMTAVPAFILLTMRTISGCLIGHFLLLVPTALLGANLPTFLVSLFDANLRYSGVGLGYNLSQSMFTGTVTMIQTALVLSNHNRNNGTSLHSTVELYDSRLYPAYYLMSIAILSLVSLTYGFNWVKNHRDRPVVKFTMFTHSMELSPTAPSEPAVTLDTIYEEQWPEDIKRNDLHKNKYYIINDMFTENSPN